MPAHPSMLFPVPDSIPDEVAVFADPFAVSLHAVTRHAPPPGGKVLVYGAGALGIVRDRDPARARIPTSRWASSRASVRRPTSPRKLGAHEVFAHEPAEAVIEQAAKWSGGRLASHTGLPMAFPGGIDVVYDTISKKETLEVGVRLLKAHGTIVKAGVHGTTNWEYTPLYFKELSWVGSNAFGIEEVDGVRKHGIHHYLDLVESGRVDLSGCSRTRSR